MLKKILEFLGGHAPKIFNSKGEVQHDLGDKKWKDWDQKNRTNPEYNWKQHTGRSSGKKGNRAHH